MKKILFYLILCCMPLAADETDAEASAQAVQEALECPYVYHSVNVITGGYCENQTDLQLPGTHPLILKRCYDSGDTIGQGWHFNHPNFPAALWDPEEDLKECRLYYEHDEEGRLSHIKTGLDGHDFHSLALSYREEGEHTVCTAQSPDGHYAAYTFSVEDPSRAFHPYLLKKIEASNGKEISYSYRGHPHERKKLVSRRDEPAGRYLINEYYDSFINDVGGTLVKITDLKRDPRIGRVKLQKAPVGEDAAPVITSRFFYHDGCTEVFNALGHKTVYRYGSNRKLTAIENYLEDGSLYRVERFYWEQDQLISKTLEDAKGEVHCCHTFAYDLYGNLVKETLFGNLTGNTETSILVDEKGQPVEDHVESYSTLYRYSDDTHHRLLFQTADNGVSIRYLTDELSGKTSGRLTYDERKNLRIREFFEYDCLGNLISTITDDGVSEESTDLRGVTERKITRFSPRKSAPARGMPEAVEQSYLDLSTGEEKLLKRAELSYSHKGEVVSQDIYDSQGCYQHTLSFEYDSCGRPIRTTDADGNVSAFAYDENGNQILYSDKDRTVKNTYNFCNRLIKVEHDGDHAPMEATAYRYDLAGNRTASSDYFGNETTFAYDALGRLIKTCYPEVVDGTGKRVRPVAKKTYDIMDRVVSSTDPSGFKTQTRYNVRGKPTQVIHSDGSMERFEYNLDGTLRKAVSRNGCYTLYDRDFQARALSEQHFSPEGELLKAVFRDYSSFRLASETDHLGKTTLYRYDGAGRLQRTSTVEGNGLKHTEITYDSAGKFLSRQEWWNEDPANGTTAIAERDPMSQSFQIRLQDAFGTPLRSSEYSNDAQKQDGETSYHYDYYNEMGQNVLMITHVDCKGMTTRTIHDAMGRVVKTELINSLGQTVQKKEIAYDLSGNKVREVHHVLQEEESCRQPYICEWKWGAENRLEKSIEGSQSDSPRITSFSYTQQGRIETVTKPDGVSLAYTYTLTGKPASLKSSDGSVHYIYTYDTLDKLIEVEDKIYETSTLRNYDANGRLIHETLGNGLSLDNLFDSRGHRTAMTLPDSSRVEYLYGPVDLKEIQRISPEGNVLYSHKYSAYSLDGKLLEEELIGELGTRSHNYDAEGRLSDITTPYWTQHIQRDAEGHIILSAVEDPAGKVDAVFAYDERQQIISETSPETHQYAYDSTRNRLKVDKQNVILDSLGQLASQGDRHYSYDPNGNLVSASGPEGTKRFQYDALNRLIKVQTEQNDSVHYRYDSFNRLITRRHLDQQDSLLKEQRFLYEGCNEIGSADERGILQELRILGVGIGAELGAAVAIEMQNKTYAPIHDHRGSICCLVDLESGNACQWTRYSAFGKEETFCPQNEEKIPCHWKFSAKRTDPETGLILFGHRFYSPEMGRWITKDPLGTPESINRFAYNLNDPVNRIDPHGLFSFSDCLQSFWGWCRSAYATVKRTLATFFNHVSFEDYIRPYADQIGQAVLGKTFLHLSGFYNDTSETGVHGMGEISDNVRITLVNGILNCRADYKEGIQLLSEAHGGANVHYIFDATDGWCWDMLKALLVKCGYISPQARMIASTWREMIDEMGGVGEGGMIYHYAHSIGGTHTKAALRLMTPEEKSMICVYTFGSPSTIHDQDLNAVYNYVSVRDGVSLLDPIGYFSSLLGLKDDITFVGEWLGVPLVDHLFTGTYGEVISLLGHDFLELYFAGEI